MKKALILLLIAALVMGFCACEKDAGQNNGLKTLTEEESVSETESHTEPISEEITETETGAITETDIQPETETTSNVNTSAPVRTRYGEKFTFSATDINGKAVSSADFANAKLIMINMWEPWCGPCVGELSDLQRLYTNYKDKGFVLLGVFADNPDDAKSIVRQKGLTYPILNKTSGFDRFHTGYVPTTVFLDGEGYPLTSEPYVGSRDYSQWEQIVKSLL